MRYKNSHIGKIIFNLTVPVGTCQILVTSGQLIWVTYFLCTDAETNRSGNSHFCATWRHNQQDPGRVVLEVWYRSALQRFPLQSPGPRWTQEPSFSASPSWLKRTPSNCLLCTLNSGRAMMCSCANEVELAVARSFSAYPPYDADTNCSPA